MNPSIIRILYIEDDVGLGRLLQKKIKRVHPNYQIEVETSPEKGLQRAIQEDFDLLLTDYEMHPINGLQVLESLCVQKKDVQVIMLTGAGNEKLAVKALHLGAKDYIIKDTQGTYLDLLPTVIEKVIYQKRLEAEKQEAVLQLQANELLFRTMFENSPIGMLRCDEKGRVLDANPAFIELIAYSSEEILSKVWFDFFSPQNPIQQEIQEYGFAFFLEQYPQKGFFETSYFSKDKEELDVRISISSFLFKDIQVFWIFSEDIRESKKMQKKAIQSNKMEAIGELAANIAHEMNNPLGIISAKARLLLSYEINNMSEKVATELSKIIDQCDRLGLLTRGLLEYARPSRVKREAIDVYEPLKKAVGIVSHQAESSSIQIIEQYPLSRPFVFANENELQQVFLNLLINAVEAMPEGGELHLAIEIEPSEEPCLKISIRDTGVGMSKETANRIFEPFFTTKEEKGTGLGLAISYGIVKNHHGLLECFSEEGKGAEFVLVLPLLEKGKRLYEEV